MLIPPPLSPFLSLVCNIELFSKRMNISCASFVFPPLFFLLMGRIEVIPEGGGTDWFSISHPQLPHSFNLVGKASTPT